MSRERKELLANVDQFLAFFHQLIRKKILCNIGQMFLAHLRYFMKFENLKKLYRIFTLNVTINVFN